MSPARDRTRQWARSRWATSGPGRSWTDWSSRPHLPHTHTCDNRTGTRQTSWRMANGEARGQAMRPPQVPPDGPDGQRLTCGNVARRRANRTLRWDEKEVELLGQRHTRGTSCGYLQEARLVVDRTARRPAGDPPGPA